MILQCKSLNKSVVCGYLLFFGYFASATSLLPNAAYEGVKVFSTASSFTYSENMPVDAITHDLKGDFPVDGQFELTHNQVLVGMGYSGVELAVFSRMDYYFRTNTDTFNLFYMDKNDVDFPIGQVFDVFLHVQQVEGEGVQLGYRFKPDSHFEMYIGGSYFETQDALYGSIQGKVWQDTDRPRGDLIADYIYNKEYILKRPLTPPGSGYGRGFDVAINWQPFDDVVVNAEFNDIAGRIDWKHAPHTRMEMVSDRNRIDANGKPYKVPTLSGQHDFVETTQIMPVHRLVSVAYQLEQPFTLTLEQETFDKVDFTRLLASFTFVKWFRVEAGHDFKSGANSLELWTPFGALLVASDSLDDKKAKNIRMAASLNYVF